MFSVGDKVVHPMHGAGVIDSIVREKIGGAYHDYYVFEMPMNGLVLKIPIDNVDAIGVRSIDSCEEIEKVFSEFAEMPTEMSDNWNHRYRENLEHMKSGNLREVAIVIKGLMYRDHERGLSTGERKMLHTVKQILVSIVSLAEDVSCESVEKRIEDAVQHP